jgi:hypothetical protein
MEDCEVTERPGPLLGQWRREDGGIRKRHRNSHGPNTLQLFPSRHFGGRRSIFLTSKPPDAITERGGEDGTMTLENIDLATDEGRKKWAALDRKWLAEEEAFAQEEAKLLARVECARRRGRAIEPKDRTALAQIRLRQRKNIWSAARQAAAGFIDERDVFDSPDCDEAELLSYAEAALRSVGGAKDVRERAERKKQQPVPCDHDAVVEEKAAQAEQARGAPDAIRQELERIEARARAKELARRKFEYRLFKDIEANPCKTWLVEDLLGVGELSVWYGAPGRGKSVLLGDLACHIAANEEQWCDRRIKYGAVLYVAAERRAVVERRFAAWRKHHGIEDIPLAVIGGVYDLRSSKEDAEGIIAAARELAAETGVEVVLIIVDTTAQVLAGGDENGKDMVALVGNVALIQAETGAHVALTHHVPHYAPERMRGHGSLPAAADTTIKVNYDGNHRAAEVDKANDGPDDVKIRFTLISVELGRNLETGKVTKAPLVIPLADNAEEAPNAKAGPKLPKATQLALRALREAVDEMGVPAPASNHIPASARVVTVEQWRDYSYKLSISSSEEPRARQQAFQRATENLQAARLIGVWDRHVWVAEPPK